MKFFNHADRDAVGICKSCGKGICHDCLVEIPDGIACKAERCESRARLCNLWFDINASLLSKGNQSINQQGMFMVLSGVFIVAVSALFCVHDSRAWIIFFPMLGMGGLMLGFGLVLRRRKNQLPTLEAEAK